MESNNEMIQSFADAFKLPVIGNKTHVWFFRTQSGLYYFDFYRNRYIALGWDLIPESLIGNIRINSNEKKKKISEFYPDEQRPGLIFSQMDTFYNKMKAGDLVVIPSDRGKTVAVGTLGDISASATHAVSDNKYAACAYKHKRSVSWLKEVDLRTDVYLSKMLRAQQTISDITDHADMVYRNLHPCYISERVLHLTLQKRTSSDFSVQDNIALQSSIVRINHILSEYFRVPDKCDEIRIKTAVGSPGFLEILLPGIPVSVVAVACVFRAFVGKTKNDNGEMATGIMAVISKGNQLCNDHWNRKKIGAEIGRIEAVTRKTDAEAAQIEANIRKTDAETAQIEANIRKMDAETAAIYSPVEKSRTKIKTVPGSEIKDRTAIVEVIGCCETIKSAAENSGIRMDKIPENAG